MERKRKQKTKREQGDKGGGGEWRRGGKKVNSPKQNLKKLS